MRCCVPLLARARVERGFPKWGWRGLLAGVPLLVTSLNAIVSPAQATIPQHKREPQPPRVVAAQRFLAQRGWKGRAGGGLTTMRGLTKPVPDTKVSTQTATAIAEGTASTATWQPLGPAAVNTANYGLVTGRVSSIALDPADSTGNRVYVGTTGGGVWLSQNAATANTANVQFAPLTDTPGAMSGARDASISVGTITVQPGGTGVVLAGTGDPNDALDSYYGAGILRSADGGNTWSLIAATADQKWAFAGEGFAGFAWSTANPQVVVAAVSQAYEGTLTNAMMAGLGANGTAGVKGATGPTSDWPQILGGEGGPVAIDPTSHSNWYVNNDAGVSIHLCSQTDDCTPADFGAVALVTDADVGGDGYTMTTPATFLVDPLDASQLLIGTCRVWRGPANGSGWSSTNAISPFLDGVEGSSACNGDALVRSVAAMALPDGGEVIYAWACTAQRTAERRLPAMC